MIFGQLFTAMNPDVKVRENSTCVWLFFGEANHYTIAAKLWNREIPDYAVELLKAQEPVKPQKMLDGFWSYERCGACGNVLYERGFAYCSWCGRKVKWDE